jgi:hypothetical protein
MKRLKSLIAISFCFLFVACSSTAEETFDEKEQPSQTEISNEIEEKFIIYNNPEDFSGIDNSLDYQIENGGHIRDAGEMDKLSINLGRQNLIFEINYGESTKTDRTYYYQAGENRIALRFFDIKYSKLDEVLVEGVNYYYTIEGKLAIDYGLDESLNSIYHEYTFKGSDLITEKLPLELEP